MCGNGCGGELGQDVEMDFPADNRNFHRYQYCSASSLSGILSPNNLRAQRTTSLLCWVSASPLAGPPKPDAASLGRSVSGCMVAENAMR